MNDDDEFIRSVLYFYDTKDNPERYSGWDSARCEKLMPAFFYAWQQRQRAQIVLDAVVQSMPQS